jgi:hypothetical protein
MGFRHARGPVAFTREVLFQDILVQVDQSVGDSLGYPRGPGTCEAGEDDQIVDVFDRIGTRRKPIRDFGIISDRRSRSWQRFGRFPVEACISGWKGFLDLLKRLSADNPSAGRSESRKEYPA